MSKGKIIGLGILLVILVGAVLAVILLMQQPAQDEEAGTNQLSLYEVSYKLVDSIRVTHDGQDTEIIKGDDGIWYLKETGEKVDQTRAETMLTYVSYVYVTKLAEENVTDFAKYGLDPADSVVEIHTTEGESYRISYGNMSADQESVYLRLNDEDKVYLQGANTPEVILRDMDSLRDLSLPTADISTLTSITYEDSNGQMVSMQAMAEQETIGNCSWQMTAPYHLYVPDSVIDSFKTLVNSMRITDFVSEEIKEEHGLAETARKAEFAYEDGTVLSIRVGNKMEEEDRYYCAVEGKEGVYSISTASFEYFEYTAMQMVLPEILPANLDDLQKMTITQNGETYTFTREDEGILKLNDRVLDAEISEAMVMLMKYITIVDEVAEDVGQPVAVITQEVSSGATVTIELREYNKEFLAADYGWGEGAQVYVSKEPWETFMRGVEGTAAGK